MKNLTYKSAYYTKNLSCPGGSRLPAHSPGMLHKDGQGNGQSGLDATGRRFCSKRKVRKYTRQLMVFVHACLMSVSVLSGQTKPLGVSEELDVFLIIGGANAAGRAPFIQADVASQEGVYILNSNRDESQNHDEQFKTASLKSVKITIDNTEHSKYAGYNRYSWVMEGGNVDKNAQANQGYNLAQSMGKVLHELTGNKIGLVVNARAGTFLDDWLSTSTTTFDDTVYPINLYGHTISRVSTMLNKYTKARLKGVIWLGGEQEQLSLLRFAASQKKKLGRLFKNKTEDEQKAILGGFTQQYKTKFMNYLVSELRKSFYTNHPGQVDSNLPFFVVEQGQWETTITRKDYGSPSSGDWADLFKNDSDNFIDLERSFRNMNPVLRSLDNKAENVHVISSAGELTFNDFCKGGTYSNDFRCLSDPYSAQPLADGVHYDRKSLELLGKRVAERYMEVDNDFLDKSSLLAHYPLNIYLHNNYKEHIYRVNNSRGKFKITGDEFLELRHWDVSGNNQHGTYVGVNKSVGTDRYIQATPPFFSIYDRKKVKHVLKKEENAVTKIEKFKPFKIMPRGDSDYNTYDGDSDYKVKEGKMNPDFNLKQGWLSYKKWSADAVQTVLKPEKTNTYFAIPELYREASATQSAFSVSWWMDISPQSSTPRRAITTRYFGIDKKGASIILNYKDENNHKHHLTFDFSDLWTTTDKQWYFFTLTNNNGEVTLYAKNFDDLANGSSGNPHDRTVKKVPRTEKDTFKASDDSYFSSNAIMSASFTGRIWNVRFFNKALSQSQAARLFAIDMPIIDYKINLDRKSHYDPLNYVNTNRQVYYQEGSEHKGERFFGNYNEMEGYTVSFWVDIEKDYDTRSKAVPFDENTVGESYFRIENQTQVLAGMERRNDVLGINRYYQDSYGEIFPWYLWLYEPATFNKANGKGKYHVVMSYYPNLVRIYMYHPNKDQFVRRLQYSGAQDLSKAKTWTVNKDLKKFSVYNWTLDSLEVNALHYFDKQDMYEEEKDLYDYDQRTTLDQAYEPGFAIVGDFGCTRGGCANAGEDCPIGDLPNTADPVDLANLNRKANPQAVSNLVRSWDPDFILTVGDNNYSDDVGFHCNEGFEENVGKYYSDYISPLSEEISDRRNFNKINRFFPVPGNHDYVVPDAPDSKTKSLDQYLSFFNLCDSDPLSIKNKTGGCSGETRGRYYSFRKGNVRFFMLNTDAQEPDGVEYSKKYDPDQSAVSEFLYPRNRYHQAWWLREELKKSEQDPDEKFQIVLMHVPPYSVNYDDGNSKSSAYKGVWDKISDKDRTLRKNLQKWKFKDWGVDAIVAGGDHNFQHIDMNGIPLLINGLGGHPAFRSLRSKKLKMDGKDVSKSKAEYKYGYAGNFGAIKGITQAGKVYLKFYRIDKSVKYTVEVSPNVGETPVKSFAVIADYGCTGGSKQYNTGLNNEYTLNTGDIKVSKMVESWSPDYIVTAGDDNYQFSSDCKNTMSAFYSNTYYNTKITGKEFFPIHGNHDYQCADGTFSKDCLNPWLNRFKTANYTIGNSNAAYNNNSNGRYYTFKQGNIRFFSMSTMYDQKNSTVLEPDGLEYKNGYDPKTATADEKARYQQAYWLQQAIAGSVADGDKYQVVLLHQSPLSKIDGPDLAVKEMLQKWPLSSWGVDLVLTADDHMYERWVYDGLDYVVMGTSGHPSLKKPTPVYTVPDGSKFVKGIYMRYGALRVSEFGNYLKVDYQYLSFENGKTAISSTYEKEGNYSFLVEAKDPHANNSPSPRMDNDLVGALGANEDMLTIYPNSTSGPVNIRLNQEEPVNGTIEVVGLDGTVLYSDKVKLSSGNHVLQVDLASLAKARTGIYILRVTTGTQQISKKIIYTGGSPEEDEEQ